MVFLNRAVVFAFAHLSVLRFVTVTPFSTMSRVKRPSFGRGPDGLPAPLSARSNESYAYYVVKHKNPRILSDLVKHIEKEKRNVDGKYDEEMLEDFGTITQVLHLLDEEMTHNMHIRPLKDLQMPDVDFWHNSIDEWIMDLARERQEFCNWFTAPFLLADCYFYRRLKEAFNMGSTSGKLKNFDYFADQKESGLNQSINATRVVGNYLMNKLENVTPNQLESQKELFVRMMELSLWGNKVDLSHDPGENKTQDLDPLKQLDEMRPNLLADDTDQVWTYLFNETTRAGAGEIGIVCDNASFELFNDMCLADFLVTSGMASKVTFHVKDMPWFVSDVTKPDVEFLLTTLEGDDELSSLGARWRRYFADDQFGIETDLFWTVADPYCVMNERRVTLYRRLAQSRLVLFKGDVNYRKLLGDVDWDHSTPFCESLLNFHPTRLVALRTMKCDIAVGLDPEKEEKAKEADDDWMIAGKYAVIQFCGMRGNQVVVAQNETTH